MKKIPFLLALIFSAGTAFSNDFSLTTTLSSDFGEIGEYLFYSNSSPNIISYLEWEVLPQINLEIKADYKINKFDFGAEISTALPLACGKMYDSDYTPDNTKYNYSIGDNNIVFACKANLFAEYNFLTTNAFDFSAIAKLNYYYNHFERTGAYGWYGNPVYTGLPDYVSYDDPNAKFYKKLSGIEYEQHRVFLFTGFGGNWKINDSFELKGTFLFSPIAYTRSKDCHKNANNNTRTFSQDMETSFFDRFYTDLTASYKLNNKIKLNAGVFFLWGDLVRGPTYTSTIDGEDIYMKIDQDSGSDLFLGSVFAGCTILF